ncbi:MAG: restriction endonuclease [Tagaea sp.]
MSDWSEYQERVAGFFREIGFSAETNVRVDGVRTASDIDVLVKSKHLGFEVVWIVECKNWKAKVSKVNVFALRQIVIDVGADRGILLSESGFQSGAIEAAQLTNVHLNSLSGLIQNATEQVYSAKLADQFDRIEICRERYWDILKEDRIRLGLRPDVPDVGYSGDSVIKFCQEVLAVALRGKFPVRVDSLYALVIHGSYTDFTDARATVEALEPLIAELEEKLSHWRPPI